jgi:hypothetical protein
MQELKILTQSLQSKLEKLVFLHQQALEDRNRLSEENELLKEKLKLQEELLSDLSLGTNPGNSIEKGKMELLSTEQLEEFLRDIENCLAILKKQQV